MAARGLDPYGYAEEYAWLVEQLDKAGILVGIAPTTDEDDATISEDLTALTQEVEALLREIRWAVAQRESQLLTADEERRLLETFALGRDAAEQLRQNPEMPSEEREEWAQLARRGQEAQELLLYHNQRLVAAIALKYLSLAHHLEFEDLFQEGMTGLMRAIERFDLDGHYRLSTYATWWIRQAITRALADQDRTVRFPVHVHERLQKLNAVTQELTRELKRSPTELELAVAMGLLSLERAQAPTDDPEVQQSIRKIQYWQRLARTRFVSLETPIGDQETGFLGDFIPAEEPSPEELALAASLAEILQELLAQLSPRHQLILIKRFGLDGGHERTLEEIGQELGVTRERIRQIQDKALERLKASQFNHKLRRFLKE